MDIDSQDVKTEWMPYSSDLLGVYLVKGKPIDCYPWLLTESSTIVEMSIRPSPAAVLLQHTVLGPYNGCVAPSLAAPPTANLTAQMESCPPAMSLNALTFNISCEHDEEIEK